MDRDIENFELILIVLSIIQFIFNIQLQFEISRESTHYFNKQNRKFKTR